MPRDQMANHEPPEGHTEESWATMRRVADAIQRRSGKGPWVYRDPALFERRDGKSYVYFIGGDVGRIKIGLSIAPDERLAALNIGSPIPLRLLAKVEGARALEREYHARFAADRAHGEWFERTDAVLAEIERLSA